MRELILGGARSGKSRLAEQRALESGLRVVYVATAQVGDGEMARRIEHHRARRPADWGLVEAPLDLAATLRRHAAPDVCLLVDCLTLWLSNLLFSGAAARQAEAVAAMVGMADQLDRRGSDLTVAGRKRLELARALATGPRLLLLDEVMAGLNPTEIVEIVEVIKAIRSSGVTILLIEHVMQAVTSLAERVYVLNQGRMIAEGSPAAIAENPQVVEAYLGHGAARVLRA